MGRAGVRDVPARAEVPLPRAQVGAQRYGALGIARGDLEARQRAASANWAFFGAPAGLFCYIHRDMVLLLRAEGLHSCPQMAWSVYRKTVAQLLSPPDGLILFCGMSIGYEDTTVVHPRTPRAPLAETVTFAA